MNAFISHFKKNSSQSVMLADINRVDGYRKVIEKYSKGKVVVDFGAGTGLLGLLAHKAGAKEVWFVEQEKSLQAIIAKHAAMNNLTNFKIVKYAANLPRNYFDVIISETLGDNAIEESIIAYNQLILDNPNCIAIPDEIEFRQEPLSSDIVSSFFSNISSYGINFIEPIKALVEPIAVQIYGMETDNSKEIHRFSLYKKLPPVTELAVNAATFENANSCMLWWNANCKGEYVTSNSPHLVDNKCNHWKQALIPADTNYKFILDFDAGHIIVELNHKHYTLGYTG
jgi:hypothetical protein